MKTYRGMYKAYFDLKVKKEAGELAQSLHDSISAITPDFSVNGCPAFILYCDEIVKALADIRNINLQIHTLSAGLPDVTREQFLRQAVIEEIQQTNEIENIRSTRREIQDELMVIENGQKGKRFDSMIRKYQLLLQKGKIPLSSCQDIRNLYNSFVLDEVLKEDEHDAPDGLYFRKDPVSVVKSSQTIHEGIFPEAALNEAMDHALLFLNDTDYDPLIRIAGFHYMFGYAHPFYNGNGRMTRFISSSMLVGENIHLLVALRLSYVIKSHRSQYYDMFKTTNDKRNFGDMTCFVIGFLRFINEACRQVLAFLTEKESLLNHYRSIIEQLNLDPKTSELLFILVQVSVCEGDSLSLSALCEVCQISAYMLKGRLQKIEAYTVCSHHSRTQLFRADLEALDNLKGSE